MVSLVWSLADTKAALGRAYAEWAVSAPTLESAVAAAAMAQDELGHARSTYPVVKALAGQSDSGDGSRRLAILDRGLPDWPAFIAANLLIDGMLTSFVAACVESSETQIASRARKILQEEGSHRVHAEAWSRRLCLGEGAELELFAGRLRDAWEHAARWLGPADDPGMQAALAAGLFSAGGPELREQVRVWATPLLSSGQLELDLAEPTDWVGWDPDSRRWES